MLSGHKSEALNPKQIQNSKEEMTCGLVRDSPDVTSPLFLTVREAWGGLG